MVRILQSTTAKMVIAAGSAVALFAGGMAWAGGGPSTVGLTGGGQIQTKIVTSVGGYNVDSLDTWENIPGATVQVNVPGDKARVITARFNAETACSADGIIFGWCSMRIVARKVGSASTIEMHPRSGSDFAIDSQGKLWDGNAIHRSLRLGSGTWNVWAQGRVAGNTGSFTVDDWHFEVEVNKAS